MARKKKQKKEELPNSSFTVMMTSLGIILLAFFIVLNAIAVVDEEKKRKALGSLIGSFGILPGGLRTESSKGKSITPPSVPLVKPEDELSILLKTLESFAKTEEGGGSLGVYGSKNGMLISIGEKFAFNSGSADIKPEAKPLLKKLAEVLIRFKGKLYIEGHTDDIPIKTKKFRSNWELSTARAVNTLRYLTEQANVPGEKLAAVGYGSSRPIVLNDTPRHRALNRRVEIVIADKRKPEI